MIPKIIHYCWLSGDPIPEKLQKIMQSWKEKLPEYQFILWDKQRFDIHSVKWVEQAYEAKKYAFAADYIRLYAVYHYGGIYMDMDIEVVKSFNELLDRPYFMGVEQSQFIEAGVFGAEKGCDFLAKCLEFYKDREFVNDPGMICYYGLPKVMSSQIGSIMDFEITEQPHFPSKKLQLFPYDFLSAKRGDTGVVCKTKNTYSIHHFEGSWLPSNRRHKIKVFLVKVFGEKVIRTLTDFVFSRK